MTEISPAILTNDLSDFRKQYAELLPLSQYYSKLHIDFADGEFVKAKTVLPADIIFFRNSKIPSMAHLMVSNPVFFFEDCKAAGFTHVLFHYETFKNEEDVQLAINEAEKLGLIPGLAIGPNTPVLQIAKFIYRLKIIQIMSIHPGAQGRDFIPETLDKVKELRSMSNSVIICVDGGIKVGIARKLAQAGANILVIGSAVSRSEDEEMALMALKADIES